MRLSQNAMVFLFGMAVTQLLAGCGQAETDDTGAEHVGHGDHANHGQADPQASTEGAELEHYIPAGYPLQTCVVGGGRLGSMGQPVAHVHEGREVMFCCAACEPRFDADPDRYLSMIDHAVVEQQSDTYPLQTCLISEDALGDEPVNFVYENRLVRFCCEMCIDTFLNDPNAGLAQLNEAAVESQLADYPAETCPISGQSLGSMGKPIDMVIGHRMVRLCCAGCIDRVRENPTAALNAVYGSPEPEEDVDESDHTDHQEHAHGDDS